MGRAKEVASAGTVVAKIDKLQVERDGSIGGFGIRVLQSQSQFLQAACFGVNANSSTPFAAFQNLGGLGNNSVVPLIVNNNATVYFRCEFGDTGVPGRVTTLELFRAASDVFWVGTITSSYDQ